MVCPGKGKWWLPSSGEMANIINLETKLEEWSGEGEGYSWFDDVCVSPNITYYLTSTVSTNTNDVWYADFCGIGAELFTIPKTATAEWLQQNYNDYNYSLQYVYVSKIPRKRNL